MGFTYQDSDTKNEVSTTSITVELNVAIGDLIIVGCGISQTPVDIAVANVVDDAGNTYTLRDTVPDGGPYSNHRLGYCLASEYASAALTITISFTTAYEDRKNAFAIAFRPDSGDTVSLDTAATKSGAYEGSPWETGLFTTTGDDEVCVAFFDSTNSVTFSNQEIPSETAATKIGTDGLYATAFYRILTSTITDAIAEVDTTGSGRYSAEVLAFKSVAAGDALTATEIATGAPTLETPTIGQTHALTATEIATGAPTLATPTVGTGANALTATEIATGAPALAIPTLGQTHALTATEIATATPSLATATIGQTHELTATEIATASPTLAVPTIGQTHALTATEIATGAPTIETSSCGTTGTNALDATDVATGAPVLDAPTIGQVHSLLAADLYAGQPTLDTATLGQIHALVASGIITGPPELGTPTVDAGIHQELVLVTGEFTQLETVTGAFTQLETVTGSFTPLVTVSGKLLEED